MATKDIDIFNDQQRDSSGLVITGSNRDRDLDRLESLVRSKYIDPLENQAKEAIKARVQQELTKIPGIARKSITSIIALADSPDPNDKLVFNQIVSQLNLPVNVRRMGDDYMASKRFQGALGRDSNIDVMAYRPDEGKTQYSLGAQKRFPNLLGKDSSAEISARVSTMGDPEIRASFEKRFADGGTVEDTDIFDEGGADQGMYRADGAKKSARGFLGPIKNLVTGGTMTEFSTDMEVDGRRIQIPTMVPTLSQEEIQYMQMMEPGKGFDINNPFAKSIITKARSHAMDRLRQGKSPFYQDIEGYQSGGSVDDFDIFDYLPSKAQLAYFGSQFAPGAGLIDAAGEMPAMPSGDVGLIDAFAAEDMPSLGENISRGEYFDAAMQGLGVLGDAMYGIPVAGAALGPTVGSVFKGVGAGGKAIKRGIEALDPVVDANRAGFETNQIMYHGTADTFTRFEPSKTGNLGEGIYFTPDPAIASNRAIVSSMKPKRSAGANVMPVYIKRDLKYLDLDYDPLTKIDIPKIKSEGFDGVRRFDKQGNLIESNIFDPDNIRPVFSVDGPPTPPKVANKDDLVQNFKQNQAPVGAIDPDTSKPITESLNRARAKRYTDNLKTPAFKRREEARAAGKIQDLVSAERTILDPNDLYGYSLVPVAGDRSGIGALTDIRGVPLSFPVAVQGGPGYPLYMSGKGKGWASMQGAANQKQMNIIQAADETGMAPLGVYTAMGREGINFSTPVVLSMVGQLDYLKIPKKQIAAFNSAVKKGTPANPGIKDFVGLNSPDLVGQLTGEMASSVSSGNIRKAVIEEMKKPRWQNMGFPVYEDVLDTVTDPALRIPRGPKGTLNPAETGYSIFKGAPSKPTFQDPYHLSYDTVIPGDYLGGLPGRGVPPEIMFPQNFARMAQKTNVAGKPLTRQQQLGSLAMEPMVEPVTDELIENLAKYLNKTQGTNFAQGGEVEDPRISRQLGFDENDAKEVALMNAGIPFDYNRSGLLSLAV